MLGRRILTSTVRQSIIYNARQSAVIAVSHRCYAHAVGPEPKLNPLSGPIPGELDPRFGDLPDWNVPEINRQQLTETPVEPYYDQQGRRYYGEPLSENDEILSVFSPDVHDHVTVPFALKWFFGFGATFAGMCYLFALSAPEKITEPRRYPYNGLEKELGGPMNPALPESTEAGSVE